MNIQVEYIDQAKKVTSLNLSISLAAFLKHAAVSGQGSHFGLLPSVVRGIGAMMFYGRYLDIDNSFNFNNIYKQFNFNGFKNSNSRYYDPTEQGDFSTIIGRSIADFLAKEILEAKFTHSYEAAMHNMGMPIAGNRPDFYCTTKNQQFAMEAKGFSVKTVSSAKMAIHKMQSQAGLIPVHFSVASVTYNIYNEIKCKFHDPVGVNFPFNRNANNALAKQYYANLDYQLDEYTEPKLFEYGERRYQSYDLSPYFFLSRRGSRQIRLLMDMDIMENIQKDYILDFEYERTKNENIYIDSDGVGIVIN